MSERNDTLADDSETASRYVVGIDLGTTNCAVGYVDTADPDWNVITFPIIQWVDLGQFHKRETLPSFQYALRRNEADGRRGDLPWGADPADVSGCGGVS